MSNEIILPKTDSEGNYYLSYSQKSKWKRSPREYIRDYFFGEKFTGNVYTVFGSKVGDALETNIFKGFSSKETSYLKKIPRYNLFEKEVKLQLGGFYVKGYIDTALEENGIITKIADYKTGDPVKKYDEYNSKSYDQLELYAAAIEQEYGVLPITSEVEIIERSGSWGKFTVGAGRATISRDVSKERIQEVIEDTQAVAKEISDHYKVFLKMKEIY